MKNKNVPHIMLKLFSVPCHAYPNISLINFSVPRTFLKTTRFAISARDPNIILWNNCLKKTKKKLITFLLFRQWAKEKIMELTTASNFLLGYCVNKLK